MHKFRPCFRSWNLSWPWASVPPGQPIPLFCPCCWVAWGDGLGDPCRDHRYTMGYENGGWDCRGAEDLRQVSGSTYIKIIYSHIYPPKNIKKSWIKMDGHILGKERKNIYIQPRIRPQPLIAFLDQVADVIFHLGLFGSLIDLSMVRAPRPSVDDGHLWAQNS